MKRVLLSLALTAAVASAPALRAAPDPLQPPDISRYLRWGPLRVRPSVQLSNFGYDDNVFYRTGDEPRVGDWTATISPRTDGLVLFGHRAFLTFREQVDGVVYARNSGISYLDQRGTTRLTVPFARLGVFVEGTVNRIHERSTSELDARPQRNETRGGVGLILPLGWRTRIELSQTRNAWTYQDDLFGCGQGATCTPIGTLLDRVETGTDLKAAYLLRGRTSLTLDASARDVAFDVQSARDSRDRRVLPGIELGPGGTLQGKLRLGHAQLDSLHAGLPDFSGVIGNVEATWSPARRDRLTLTARRDVNFAVWSGNQFHVNWQAEARGVHWMTRAIGLELAALHGRLRFSDLNRLDSVDQYEGGIRFRLAENALGRRVEYTFHVRRFQRDSAPDDGLDQSRTSLGFGAVLGY